MPKAAPLRLDTLCALEKKIHTGQRAQVSILLYKSHKNQRAAASTLLNEATGKSEALADSEWVASCIGLCKDLEYDLRKRHLLNREIKIASLTTCHDNSELDLASITDAKSLLDNLMQVQYTGAEKRAALEICVIRDSLESLGGRARWVPHDRNPADCLTKLKGNVDSLLKLMREGSYILVDEVDEMAQRRAYRDATGKKNPRPNHSYDTGRPQHTTQFFNTLHTAHLHSTQPFSSSPASHCHFLQIAHPPAHSLCVTPVASAVERKAAPVTLQCPSTASFATVTAAVQRAVAPEMPPGPHTTEAAAMSRQDVQVSISGLGSKFNKARIQGYPELTKEDV